VIGKPNVCLAHGTVGAYRECNVLIPVPLRADVSDVRTLELDELLHQPAVETVRIWRFKVSPGPLHTPQIRPAREAG
jgi:hypothetical protein